MHTRPGRVGLPESFEDIGKKIGFDSNAGIGDANLSVRIRFYQVNGDTAPGGGELDRICEQIPDDLLQAVGIAKNKSVQWR